MLSNKDALQAIQAAMGNPAFMPFPFTPPTAYMHHSLSQQQHHPPNSHTPSGNNGGPANNNSSSGNAMISSASSHSSESSQGSARNGIDSSRDTSQNNNSQNNGPAGNAHQQQTSWSFEEQFKQVRQTPFSWTRIDNNFYVPKIGSDKFFHFLRTIHFEWTGARDSTL